MKEIGLLLLFAFFTSSLLANRTEVATASEINNASWQPGDTIVMLNGTWTDQSISIKANGTLEHPIVLMAETPGDVILNGTSKLGFSGKHIVVMGLYFKGGNAGGSAVISFRTSSSRLADSCRVTNTTIEDYNPSNKLSENKWVSIYGKDNRVDHCSFINKANIGTLLVVWLKSGIIPNHIIDQNYFGYRIPIKDSNGKELNGQEIIRIGTSTRSMQNARVVVSNNFFEHCDGEIEIISNKSCENRFVNNVFFECVGMLTLRHGNRCTVENNYFFGSRISNTGGVRIIGEDHKVYNNYFEGLRGTGYRAALCMVRGKENSALNEYFQVKNAEVMFNTFVNCSQSFGINYNSSSSLKEPPIGCTVAHNHVYNTSFYNCVTIYQVNVAEMDVTWKNNLINKGSFNGFRYTPEEVVYDVDPSMERAGTSIDIFEPIETSALSEYATNEFSIVEMDLRGRDRDTVKIPGASQLSGEVKLEMPEKSKVGANYLLTSARTIHQPMETYLEAFASRQELVTDVIKPGTIQVYNITGQCILQEKIEAGKKRIPFTEDGLFIVRFLAKDGGVASKKILFY